MKKAVAAIFSVVFLMGLRQSFASDGPGIIFPEFIVEELKINDYTVRIYRNAASQTYSDDVLQILKGEKVVLEQQEDHRYSISTNDEMLEHEFVKQGQDITGDGEPNLVVRGWSGGMHCCFDFSVFSLGKEFKLIENLFVADAGSSRFQDLDHDGIWEFMTRDLAFAYWNASFADSPAPEVILRYKDGQYVLAPDLMARPVPTPDEEKAILARDQESEEHLCSKDYWSWQRNGVCLTPNIWGHMLDLIYTGHPDEAWAFLDRVWKGNESTKQWFVYDFKRQLVSSPYADQLPVDLFAFGSVATDRFSGQVEKILKIMEDEERNP